MKALSIQLLAVWLLTHRSPGAALPALSENDFKGNGICQLAVHGFTFPAQSEKAIDDSVRQLLERHRAALGFMPRADFRLRMRVFGSYADYTNATFNLYWTNAEDRRALQGRPFNVAGFYTPATKEIVTWRQQLPGFLGTTMLHEAGHAIMDAHYENVPVWLMEGSADFFAFALHAPGEVQQRILHRRWTRLNEWLRDHSLVPLRKLVDASNADFKDLDPEKAYTTSWSLFQLLMSTNRDREVMLALLAERQELTSKPPECSEQLGRLREGGLARLETAWHAWIAAGAAATTAPAGRLPGNPAR